MSETAPPILLRYEGEGEFKPVAARWAREADKHYVIGDTYYIVEHQGRSLRSHNHFFAAVNEAWQNLPEDLAGQYPSADHLRKYALIKAGYFNSQTLVCSSKAEAIRIAAFVRPADEYAIVRAEGPVVTRFTAKSQSVKAMGRDDFQHSKDAVLDVLADMIGTTRGELQRAQAA